MWDHVALALGAAMLEWKFAIQAAVNEGKLGPAAVSRAEPSAHLLLVTDELDRGRSRLRDRQAVSLSCAPAAGLQRTIR